MVIASLVGLAGCEAIGEEQRDRHWSADSLAFNLSFGNVQTGTSQSGRHGYEYRSIYPHDLPDYGDSRRLRNYRHHCAGGHRGGRQRELHRAVFAPTATGAVSGNVAFTTGNGEVDIPPDLELRRKT